MIIEYGRLCVERNKVFRFCGNGMSNIAISLSACGQILYMSTCGQILCMSIMQSRYLTSF